MISIDRTNGVTDLIAIEEIAANSSSISPWRSPPIGRLQDPDRDRWIGWCGESSWISIDGTNGVTDLIAIEEIAANSSSISPWRSPPIERSQDPHRDRWIGWCGESSWISIDGTNGVTDLIAIEEIAANSSSAVTSDRALARS